MSQTKQLEQAGTVIVADTGEINDIKKYKPTDATTNPSLIFKASQLPEYQHLVEDAVQYGKAHGKTRKEQVENAMDRLAVNFGVEIAKVVPGVVSTEVDARLSFKPNRTIAKARKLIKMYAEKGVPSDKILIKIASTWQGIQAGEILEREGIHVNMTLLFNKPAQAVACAEAGVTLISPFVGRITDWYKKQEGVSGYDPEEDPGVKSVRSIYNYYKEHGYTTIVMGASFRNKGQILALAGCDKLTIGPKFLKAMAESTDRVVRKLAAPSTVSHNRPPRLDDRHFYMRMCRDPMALEKLHEGIRGFVKDTVALEKQIAAYMFGPSAKL
jgi:transaldolase